MSVDGAATQRLQELFERYALEGLAASALTALLEVIAEDPSAPTSVRDPRHAADVHIADSLTALALDAVRRMQPGGLMADLGAGAGFPGLVLAAARPAQSVALVESQERKCAFLRRAAARMELSNAQVVRARAEEWQEGLGVCAVVTARALAAQPVVLEYAAPLLEVGGSLLDWRGERQPSEEEASRAAAAELGLSLEEITRTEPFAEARDHHIHVFRKVAPTPQRYPRRPGMARKRPLGG